MFGSSRRLQGDMIVNFANMKLFVLSVIEMKLLVNAGCREDDHIKDARKRLKQADIPCGPTCGDGENVVLIFLT